MTLYRGAGNEKEVFREINDTSEQCVRKDEEDGTDQAQGLPLL